VITGFNTDINFEGVTYHVQTEDKGLRTPLILSLVYQGGTILASKRSPYDDLLVEKFDEKLLEDRLNRQHTLICAAIRAGRIEDLKRMTMKDTPAKGLVATRPVTSEKAPSEQRKTETKTVAAKADKELIEIPPIVKQAKPPKPEPDEPVLETPLEETPFERKPARETPEKSVKPVVTEEESEPGIPKPAEAPVWDIPIIEDVIIVEENYRDASEIIEEEIFLPPDAVEIVGDLERFGSLIDEELKIKILGENKFRSGDRKNINILVCRGKEDRAVNYANVMVKVIGSDFRPLIYHSQADGNGVATVFLKLPSFRSGRAAILIRAMIEGEETELRRVVTPE
jgi:hypothetical protein